MPTPYPSIAAGGALSGLATWLAAALPRSAGRLVGILILALAGLGAPSAEAHTAPKRVLIVHSFGRQIAPYDAGIAAFRRELASRSPEPVVFMETALDAGRPMGPTELAVFVAYLRERFSDPPPDLIVSSGGPAAQFLARHRDEISPGVPLLLTALESRVVPRAALRPGDAVASNRIELPLFFDTMARVLPDVATVAVVLGITPLERYWREQMQRDSAQFARRVNFLWLDGLSMPQIKQRVATLPPHSAVYYGLMIVDGAGVPYEGLQALAELRQVANAPIFSVFENELGLGVVGGPYISPSLVGAEAATLALRQMSAASVPSAMQEVTVTMDRAAYDARELRHWQIDESRLPPGSEVRYRQPSPWVQYRQQIVAVSAVIVMLLALIAALLVQRARRRRAEVEARALGGRLITAYEDEGRRLARELHDDVTQRLAGLAMETAALGRHAGAAERAAAEQSISSELAHLSRDVHALSYRLHPSVIDDLGLEEALRIECERVQRRGSMEVTFHCDAASGAIRGDRALCLFRVGQEALRNAVRHAQGRHVRVELRAEREGTALSVVDDGRGFDPAAPRERASLGLASMRERVALLGGRLDIRSHSGQGTHMTVWLPPAEAAA